jgi:hypothetical protein
MEGTMAVVVEASAPLESRSRVSVRKTAYVMN